MSADALNVKIIEFWKREDFPYCVGSTDGKHARKLRPSTSGPVLTVIIILKNSVGAAVGH
jgi:hypothetical protein